MKKRKQKIYKWLRDRTSSIDYGFKYLGHPIHCNTNEEVLDAFNNRQWLSRITNDKFHRHFSGESTSYFTGNGNPKFPETLVMIDIDCHKTGTLAGAIAFAKYLREHHFQNLYFETSTNGNGVHGYIVLRKFDTGADFINGLLRRLQQQLRDILREQEFDVEDVEIKGTCPVLTWGKGKGELANYKSGQLAKLPREAHRFEELKNTTSLTYHDLLKLEPVRQKRPLSQRTIAPQLSTFSGAGSISGRVISEEEIEQVSGHYGQVADVLMETHSLTTSTRAVATREDVAIFLVLLRFFTNNMNADGSLPYKRFRQMWQVVFEAGDIDRQFDDSRFAAVRDYLSSLGLLDWKNKNYEIGWVNENGQYIKGKAAKWKASEVLMELLDWEKVAVTGGDVEQVGEADSKKEEERTSLTRTTITEIIQSLDRTPERDIIKPILADETSDWRLNPDEIPDIITSYDEQLRLAA
jgi:hypothetical protein